MILSSKSLNFFPDEFFSRDFLRLLGLLGLLDVFIPRLHASDALHAIRTLDTVLQAALQNEGAGAVVREIYLLICTENVTLNLISLVFLLQQV